MLTVTVIITGIICSSTANHFTPPPSDEDLSVMTVDDTNDVFVASENLIYKLSANLSQLMNVSVSSDDTVGVRGLSVSNGGQYIVACLTTGICIGYDVINLNATDPDVPLNEPMGSVFPGIDPVVIFPGDAEGIIHTGTAVIGGSPAVYRMSLGQYNVSLGSIMAYTTRDYTLMRFGRLNTRIFKAGFTIDNFTYYIVEDDNLEIRVLRVCNSETGMFRGLYEIQLACDQLSTVFAGASVPPNLTDTLVLTVRTPDGRGARSGRVCAYNISDINTAMENGRIVCANDDDNTARDRIQTVWNVFTTNAYAGICAGSTECSLEIMIGGSTLSLEAIRGDTIIASSDPRSPLVIEEINNQFSEFASSVIVQGEGELLLFIGTRDGMLLKYNLVNQNFSNPVRYNTTSITNTSITSLQWSLGSDYVYGLTSRQVIAIPVEDCESFSDCTSCSGLGDPLCGWCSIEDKCSRRRECSNNSETRRWIQNQTMCIVNFAISPTTHPVEVINQQFNLTADQLPPPLDDENYYCVFGDVGSSLLEGNLIPGVNFTGLTCNYSFIVEQFNYGSDDTAVVNFSLRSDLTNINFITIDNGFTFFNCSTHTNCHSCLSSNNLCGWCLYDKKCTSSSDQCRVSTDWINTGNSSNASCPLILSRTVTNRASDYQQPVGVLHNLSLNAINLPAPNENYTYQCVISYNGLVSRIQAEYTGPNNGLVCVSRMDDFEQAEYVSDASVSVVWTGPNVMYNLETEVDPLTVILYNCTALAGGCSSCLSATNLLSLDCGWCRDLRSCVVNESCLASSLFTTSSSDTCPSPQITTVSPNSGPYQGGTTITITGTDLGVVVEDIINVTIGGVPCMINSRSYQPGIGFNCITSETSTRSSVNVNIQITRTGVRQTAILSDGFRYAEVIITDFSPKRIPLSGNIIISIYGNNFNISNPKHARIEIAETSCVIDQGTLNGTFVQCVAGVRPGRGSGPVSIFIDNSVSESDADFTYIEDPRVFSVSPMNIIRSGGITVTFVGEDLDVVPTVLVIDIVDLATNTTALEMPYNIGCTAESSRALSCIFPAIFDDDMDDILNRTLELRYSLVAASVPGLDNLHLMAQFKFQLVNNPVIFILNEIISYEPGSGVPLIIHGEDLEGVVDQSEVRVTVGNRSCGIVSYEPNMFTCIPPQNGEGIVSVMVYIGENLNYAVGSLQYSSNASNDDSSTTTILIIIITVMAVLLILSIIIIVSYRIKKRKSKKHTIAFTGNTDVTMYTSPAYGTHHVSSEPGLDHLYEPIDELHKEKSTTFQEAATVTTETDVDGYVKINSSCKADDKAIAEGNTQCNAGNDNVISDEEYIQAADDKDCLPTDTNDGDINDSYENDDEYLQMQDDDREEDMNLK